MIYPWIFLGAATILLAVLFAIRARLAVPQPRRVTHHPILALIGVPLLLLCTRGCGLNAWGPAELQLAGVQSDAVALPWPDDKDRYITDVIEDGQLVETRVPIYIEFEHRGETHRRRVVSSSRLGKGSERGKVMTIQFVPWRFLDDGVDLHPESAYALLPHGEHYAPPWAGVIFEGLIALGCLLLAGLLVSWATFGVRESPREPLPEPNNDSLH